MTMRLYAYLLEGRNWAVKDSYVKLQVGKFKSKTRVLKNTTNPVWNEEFVFKVNDLEDELVVSVYQYNDDSRLFNLSGDFLGQVRIPVWSLVAEENQNLPPTWFSLEKHKILKSINKDYGKILLSLSLHGRDQDICSDQMFNVHPSNKNVNSEELEGSYASSHDNPNIASQSRKMVDGKQVMKTIACRLEKLYHKNEEMSKNDNSSDLSTNLSDYEDCMEETSSDRSFEESLEMMQSREKGQEMPASLHGGILLDQKYAVPPKDLNILLFSPNSQFSTEIAELQERTNIQEGTWTWKSDELSCLTRVVTYTKAATKLVKAVIASEEQTYVKADGREFAVFVSVNTPDVPYGGTFKVELLYAIVPVSLLDSGEECSHLVISWGINFCQNSMMKGMIEGGVRQGLKENFDQFANLLAQKFEVVHTDDKLDKDHVLGTLQKEHQSDWKLAVEYFWNFTVVSTIVMILYVFLHILLCRPSRLQGLEFSGLDLPDTFGELITSGIIVMQLERVYNMVSHFVQARLQRASDHGVEALGEGWMLTVALIEGINLPSLDSGELPDPYVVFTSNGKTRTSSVKLQTLDPQWNDILEFDAAEEPPSVLDVEVFDFDGPFDQAAALGHSEINFLKHTSTELADMWVPLEGKLVQSSQSKLHLRIFLDNKNGVETIKEYLTKIEKEVGKRLNLRSPHRNSTFQKHFGLPPEEFLISDFSCSLKRKMPLQGRLFLSARSVAFYANLFGHRTKFFFLWEDIEDIQVLPPSLSSVGSPILHIVLRKGRGLDARHGAKSQDGEGRLLFYFHSFVSFNAASRTIMALWRTRTFTSDQKAQIAEEEQDEGEKPIVLEGTGPCFIVGDTNMSNVYLAEIAVDIKSLMEMFNGGNLEHKVMGKSGCLNYMTTAWEPLNPEVYERHLSYKFNRGISIFGGEVTCTQQKSPMADDRGWIVNETRVLHDVPFGDHFRVVFKFVIESSKVFPSSCKCDVYLAVTWLKSSKFQDRITRNITKKFTHCLKGIFQLVEHEVLSKAEGSQQ